MIKNISQLVNSIGRYLYHNLDGAFDFNKSPNMFDVYVTLLYQYEGDSKVHEMTLNLNVTTYLSKIRVNTIELSPQERTLGYDLYEEEDVKDLPRLKDRIYKRLIRRVSKAYGQGYQFLI